MNEKPKKNIRNERQHTTRRRLRNSGTGKKITKLNEVRHLITYGCNLRCKHCYLDAGAKKDRERPAKELTQKELDGFYLRYKPKIVSATGGEPLLRLDLVKKITKSVAKYGGALELVTNGFLLKEDTLDALLKINPHTFVQVSLDGTDKTHDKMRSDPGAYKKAMAAIGMAIYKKIPVKVRLTATDDNIRQIPELIKKLDAFGKKNITLVVRPVLPVGRAKENDLKMNIDYRKLDMFKKIANYIKVETTDTKGKCGCGINTVAIDPLGDIYPCTYFVFDNSRKIGNIAQRDPLREQMEFKKFKGMCFARGIKSQK